MKAAALLTAALLAPPAPAQAWEFTPGLPCLLTHRDGDLDIRLTYDPTQPKYTITLTRTQPWPDADVFGLRFDGPAPISIGTDRHERDATGRSVTVTDTGFGNVLDGLQFNAQATVTLGALSVSFPLGGAEAPVAAFRACKLEAGT